MRDLTPSCNYNPQRFRGDETSLCCSCCKPQEKWINSAKWFQVCVPFLLKTPTHTVYQPFLSFTLTPLLLLFPLMCTLHANCKNPRRHPFPSLTLPFTLYLFSCCNLREHIYPSELEVDWDMQKRQEELCVPLWRTLLSTSLATSCQLYLLSALGN